jgi:Icc-related predicted phosphoesterase
MSLHGHIHESPKVSGLWNNKLGNTICIQPGQTELGNTEFNYVIIDTNNKEYKRFVEPCEYK